MSLTKEKLISMYRTMVRIRRFEERVACEFADGKIPGSVHSYIGEEAVATGAIANLTPEDYIASTHRGHGHLIAKGGKPDRMMAELFNKRTGYNKGKGGSMHIANTSIGILGAVGIVGSGITLGTGAALSAKIRKTSQVALCFFGDGASNTGRFHEGINMASIWKLPVVYICENNRWAISMPVSAAVNISNIADRAVAYGIPGVAVDGMDVLEVYEAVGEAVARARRGEGPTLVECKTYRFHGHFEGDAAPYRTMSEVEEWINKDPIKKLEVQLIEMGVLSKEAVSAISQDILDEMDKAVEFAYESPFPEPREALEDVFA